MSYPPSYSRPPRQGPNCWAVGAIGCLVLIIAIGVATFVGIAAFMKSNTGKEFVSSMNTGIKSEVTASACVPDLRDIGAAINRYHEANGKYPPNLKALDPKYLSPGTSLHCGTDTNDDPSHVTYEYIKPTESTPRNAPVVRYSWKLTMTFGGVTQTETSTEQIALDGTVTKTTTSANGSTMTEVVPNPGS